MSVPFKKSVFLVDAMAFRRARAESFLNPWAQNESVELISLDPDEAHKRLVEHAACDMLIYSVGAPSPHEVFAEIQVLHTLRRDAALAIVSDDENPATVLAAIRCGAQGYFSNSMAPELALQAFSFVLHGGTYFPPAAILASRRSDVPAPIEHRQPDLSRSNRFPRLNNKRRRRLSDRRTASTSRKSPFSTTRCLTACRASPCVQRHAACARVYRAAVCRSRLSLPGRPQQGNRPQARHDRNHREGSRPRNHAQAWCKQPDPGRDRRIARLSDSAVELVPSDSPMVIRSSIPN